MQKIEINYTSEFDKCKLIAFLCICKMLILNYLVFESKSLNKI